MWTTESANFSKSYLDGYDFSITYISEINDTVFNTQNSFLIINSAAYKKDICLCEELIRLLDIDTIFILRDKLGSIGKKYIERFMISSNRILCMHEVEFDEYDKKYQYSMDYDGVVDFKYISDDLCRVLIKSISVISGKSQTIVRKALKWAKGGKVFDNRFLE